MREKPFSYGSGLESLQRGLLDAATMAVVGATAKESFRAVPDGVQLLLVALFRRGLRRPSISAIWMIALVDCRAGLPGCTAMENYPRVRSPLRFGLDLHGIPRTWGTFSRRSGPNLWYYIFLASAVIAVEVEATSTKLARGHCVDQRFGLCPRSYYGGSPAQLAGLCSASRDHSVCFCRDPAVHDVSSATFRVRSNPQSGQLVVS